MMNRTRTLSQFQGCLFGKACADAVGSKYEGLPPDLIRSLGGADTIVRHDSKEKICYTDDTQMAIGIVETLIDCGQIEEERLIRAFGENYQPERAYGPTARHLLIAMAKGEYRHEMTTQAFPDGSYGNGAAMRVAPLGVFFGEDELLLEDQVVKSCRLTHVHQYAIDGARAVAKAVSLAIEMKEFDRADFLLAISDFVQTEEFQWQLKTAAKLPRFSSLEMFGNSLAAHQSVVTSLICFADSPDDYSGCISRAIGAGGDVDTLAAMAGAISGARLGIEAIPANLMDSLEDDRKGKSYLFELSEKLFARYLEG